MCVATLSIYPARVISCFVSMLSVSLQLRTRFAEIFNNTINELLRRKATAHGEHFHFLVLLNRKIAKNKREDDSSFYLRATTQKNSLDGKREIGRRGERDGMRS